MFLKLKAFKIVYLQTFATEFKCNAFYHYCQAVLVTELAWNCRGINYINLRPFLSIGGLSMFADATTTKNELLAALNSDLNIFEYDWTMDSYLIQFASRFNSLYWFLQQAVLWCKPYMLFGISLPVYLLYNILINLCCCMCALRWTILRTVWMIVLVNQLDFERCFCFVLFLVIKFASDFNLELMTYAYLCF